MKKQQIKCQIYQLFILLANTWGNSWLYIQQRIEGKLKKVIQLRYKNLDKNLNRLVQEQRKTPKEIHTFYPRVVNNTNITFTNSEIKLLDKGPKYNLHRQKKNWLTTLTLEVETAITHLLIADREYYRKQVADRIEILHNNSNPKKTHPEARILKSIQTKLKPTRT